MSDIMNTRQALWVSSKEGIFRTLMTQMRSNADAGLVSCEVESSFVPASLLQRFKQEGLSVQFFQKGDSEYISFSWLINEPHTENIEPIAGFKQ